MGSPVRSLAYPYGAVPRPAARPARLRAIRRRLHDEPAHVRPASDPLCLPRVDVHYLKRPALFRRVVSGGLEPYLRARGAVTAWRRRGRCVSNGQLDATRSWRTVLRRSAALLTGDVVARAIGFVVVLVLARRLGPRASASSPSGWRSSAGSSSWSTRERRSQRPRGRAPAGSVPRDRRADARPAARLSVVAAVLFVVERDLRPFGVHARHGHSLRRLLPGDRAQPPPMVLGTAARAPLPWATPLRAA